jgi:hypothetical protein
MKIEVFKNLVFIYVLGGKIRNKIENFWGVKKIYGR